MKISCPVCDGNLRALMGASGSTILVACEECHRFFLGEVSPWSEARPMGLVFTEWVT